MSTRYEQEAANSRGQARTGGQPPTLPDVSKKIQQYDQGWKGETMRQPAMALGGLGENESMKRALEFRDERWENSKDFRLIVPPVPLVPHEETRKSS